MFLCVKNDAKMLIFELQDQSRPESNQAFGPEAGTQAPWAQDQGTIAPWAQGPWALGPGDHCPLGPGTRGPLPLGLRALGPFDQGTIASWIPWGPVWAIKFPPIGGGVL